MSDEQYDVLNNRLLIPFEYIEEESINHLLKPKKEVLQLEKKDGKHSFLWYDTGLSLDHAISLGSKGNVVYYFTEYRTRYPHIEDYISGYGFNEIQKVMDYGTVLDNVDVIVFSDVGFATFSNYLRKHGKAVFGASILGEQLENDRVFMLSTMQKLGIKVPQHTVLQGKKALLDHAEKYGFPFYVKLNIFRGNFETMKVNSMSELILALEESKFGMLCDELTFIVTKPVKGVEIGVDTFFNGNEFLYPINFGNEVKGTGSQHNKIVDECVWDEVLISLEEYLKNSGYRGAISFEGIYDGNDISLLDVTARLFYPASSIYPANLENYDDVIYAVANGEHIIPKFKKKYAVTFVMTRERENRWTKINMESPELFNTNVFFPRGVIKANNEIWAVPNDRIIAVVVGLGDSYNESLQEAIRISKTLSANESAIDYSSVERYKEDYLTELENYGIVF